MTPYTSRLANDVRKYLFEQANQHIHFLCIEFPEKTVIILLQGTHKLKNPSFSWLEHNSTKLTNVFYLYFKYWW